MTDPENTQADEQWADKTEIYRSVSRLAVASLVVALFSQLAWIFPALALIGAAAVVMGWIARKKIRRFSNELTGSMMANFGLLFGLIAFIGGPSMHWYILAMEVPEGYLPISFHELRPNEVEKSQKMPVPLAAKEYDGKTIFVRGYVHPGVASLDDIKQFVLVPDMKTCCFGGQPKLTDMIEITVVKGQGVEYSYRRRGIGGVFRLRPRATKGPGGINSGYYVLDADHVQ